MSPSRARKGAAARVRPFWVVIALALLAAAAGAFYGAQWPGFHPRRITIVGAAVVSRTEVLRRADIDQRRNIWLQDTSAAAARIASMPYVKTVEIRRRLPADVAIFIQERKPFAIITDGDAELLVDDALRVLDGAGVQSDLPRLRSSVPRASAGETLHSARLTQLVRDCKALIAAGVPISYLNLDHLGNLNARLFSGVLIEFGDDSDILQKARLVNPVLSQVPLAGRKIRALDLRAPRTPVVVFVH